MNDSAFLNSRRTGIFKDMSNGTICIPKDLRDNNGLVVFLLIKIVPKFGTSKNKRRKE